MWQWGVGAKGAQAANQWRSAQAGAVHLSSRLLQGRRCRGAAAMPAGACLRRQQEAALWCPQKQQALGTSRAAGAGPRLSP